LIASKLGCSPEDVQAMLRQWAGKWQHKYTSSLNSGEILLTAMVTEGATDDCWKISDGMAGPERSYSITDSCSPLERIPTRECWR
jgi:hypothetical protein